LSSLDWLCPAQRDTIPCMQIPKRKPPTFSHPSTDPLITEDKFNELTVRLQRLKTERPRLADEVHRLAQNGDFSENAEYQMAKGRLRGLNDSIDRLEQQLNHAEIISKHSVNHVQIGSTVTVQCPDGSQKKFQILGSQETDPSRGIISHQSPIGAQLLLKKIGDTVELKRAASNMSCSIIKIE